MADTEEEEPKKKGGNKMLIIILVVVNVLALGGGAFFLLASKGGDDEDIVEDEEGDDEEEQATPENQFGPLVEMKPLVANLDDPTAGRYVKITLHFEIHTEEQRPLMESALVPIRSRLLVYFTGVKLEDTIGKNNKLKIINDVKQIADEMVGEEVVRRVFFTEFVTQ